MSDSDGMPAIELMRQTFASHCCEDFTGRVTKLSRTRACVTAWIRGTQTEERIASLMAAGSTKRAHTRTAEDWRLAKF